VGPGPAKGSRSSRASCCTTPMTRAVHIHPVHQHLELEGIAPSIGTVGDAYPKALMESIIGLFKTEAIATTVHDGPYKALADVEYVAAGWVDWYNHRRLHWSLGWLTPSSTSRTTTLPSAESRDPHRGGREPVTLHPALPQPTPPHRHGTNPRRNLRHPAGPGPSDPRHQRRHRRTPPRPDPLEPSRDYQPTGAPKGPSCKTPN